MDFLIFKNHHRLTGLRRMLPLLLVRTKLGGVNGCKFIIYKLFTFRLSVLYFNPIQFFKNLIQNPPTKYFWHWKRIIDGKGPSLENGNGQSRLTPRLVINVDHHIVGIIAFVLVNPLSATPLFSPSSLARAACAVRSRGFHAAGSESRTSPKFAARRLLGNAPQGLPRC